MIRAIDMHTHIHTGDRARAGEKLEATQSARSYFRSTVAGMTPDEMAEMYQQLEMLAVVFDVDQETRTGMRISNDEIAGWVRKYPQTFIGFGSVDPWKGQAAVREVQRCADLGLRGMKFQQATQAFAPNHHRFYPIYEACARLGLPVLFHIGTTGIGAGAPGGRGIHLEFCRPIPYVDDVAADFPELRVILAHPGWPWHDEQLAVVRHKGNCYMDLSGWAPKYFPASVVRYANTLIQDRVFFGTDFPMLSPERWLAEFDALPFKPEVRRKILLENAARFLGLELPAAEATTQG